MGRVFNAIELTPYYARPSEASSPAERVVEDDRTIPTYFASTDADDGEEPDFTEAPNHALPRWQQQMREHPENQMNPLKRTSPQQLLTHIRVVPFVRRLAN